MHPAGEEGYTKTSYEEDFAFTTTEGTRIEGKTDLAAYYWDRIKPGDTFQVTYAKSEPGTFHIGTDTSTTLSDCVFVGVLAIWVVFLTLTIRARHRRPSPRTAPAGAPDTYPARYRFTPHDRRCRVAHRDRADETGAARGKDRRCATGGSCRPGRLARAYRLQGRFWCRERAARFADRGEGRMSLPLHWPYIGRFRQA